MKPLISILLAAILLCNIETGDGRLVLEAEIIGNIKDDGYIVVQSKKRVEEIKNKSVDSNCCYTMIDNDIGIDCNGNKN